MRFEKRKVLVCDDAAAEIYAGNRLHFDLGAGFERRQIGNLLAKRFVADRHRERNLMRPDGLAGNVLEEGADAVPRVGSVAKCHNDLDVLEVERANLAHVSPCLPFALPDKGARK